MEGANLAHREMLDSIAAHTSIKDLTRIEKAYEYALEAHGNQLRKDGSLYITHPLHVAAIVAEMGLDEDSIVAAILHDVIEDTPRTHEEIARAFGDSVADIVEGVSKLTRVTYTSKEEEQMENLRKMFLAMAKDIRVILIKIADRLHNMRTMNYQSAAKQREKSLETMEIYAPIAHRLGMQKIKLELEDLSLIYLDPVGYAEIETELRERGGKYEGFMERTEAAIKERMAEAHIRCTVQKRIKDIYSIYRKMYGQNKELSEVMDVYAFRVIVDDIADCYNVLGCIHELYKPIPGRFKDYIGTPKPNMYQSLHTTVIGSEGIPFEVQIRTWEMHQTAEYGIAAHWKYKEGISGKSDEEKFAWIRNLLESQQESDASDFFSSLKVDMFSDEVYVFTPNGDVKNLPAGATPIDFAYSIHSAVGNQMTIAKVNGRIVPFSHELQSGDIVEIITSASAKGPSRDWLKMVKSSEARNKIRQWFKKERRDENILTGKAAFEAEMRRLGVPLSVAANEEIITPILKKFSYSSIEDLYASIGYGGISAQKLVNRLRDDSRALEKNAEGDKPEWNPAASGQKPVHGIIVEGVDNVLVKFSHCCMPVPGDEVVGFITKGFGVSIHRTDCKNYHTSVEKESDKNRWIRVAWAAQTDERYGTGIAIAANDRDGLVMDIATLLTTLKVRVSGLTARDIGGGRAEIYLTIEVKDKAELSVAMAKLMAIRGVREVRRQGT
ncbi:MAG: bifunctional (p)ppGpp synthetase/guanosine-3',5'-bis(diphosphate) 3'-pyrophosphohydrolase [Oscillospiraceae bacterium]|nr:bifunctional (p)ppGpp synthetase/guanosine-3',5'-bis(diphosphate) 3'-pyrophosphohydrolase [Oscillospiraceae bacterium]